MKRNKIDNEIILAFKNHNEEAFNKIYKQYHKRIYFFVFQHCHNEEMAKDIVQNTFISVYQGIEKLKHPEAFHQWILQIAYNELQTIMKKEGRYPLYEQDFEECNTIFDFKQLEISEKIENIDFFNILHTAIKSMSPKLREIAILRYYEELSNREISNVLSISIGTVKSRSFRMHKILQKELQRHGINPKTFHSKTYAIPIIFTTILQELDVTIESQQHIYTRLAEISKIVGPSGSSIGIVTKIALQKTFTLALISISAISFLIYQNSVLPTTEEMIVSAEVLETVEKCRFTNISYKQEFTNTAIQVDIQTSNANYDAIHINDEDTRYIHQNGTYIITLIKDRQIIDQQSIEITNIDKQSPEILSIDKSANQYFIVVNDSESGLDFSSLMYYQNGQISNAVQYDIATQTIIFEYLPFSSNIIYIQDYAKNWREISFVSDQINLN